MKAFLMAVVLCVGYITNNAANIDTSFYLIPQPKKIDIRNSTYSFSKPYTINASDTFSKALLGNAITSKFKAPAASFPNTITLAVATGADFDVLIKSEKLNPSFDLGEEGYIISISPNSIKVVAHSSAGVFYGVQTLIQLLQANTKNGNLPCMVVYDKPDMAMRGWQDDISRGPIPTLDFLKEEIRRMASFKLNTFTLYTEHVFKLHKHPAIAPADGITAEEIKELATFAKDYHVDVIGNYQSFGHFEHTLEVPAYKYLGENEATLSPSKEESYQFLSDVYSEVVPAYSSKYFHINCDEVSLDNGPSKRMIDSMGIDGVYAYHINRIDSLLKPYGKQIMMWGDIAVNNPKIINRLPKDMIIVSWGYSAQESFEHDILPFVKSGFRFIVAPGVSCWSAIYPDMSRATTNIYNYLRDGYKHKAMGFINTTWDDDGQNLFNNNWYSLIWGADCGWNAPASEPVAASEVTRKNRLTAFNRCYNKLYYGTAKDITSLLWAVSGLKYGPVKNCLSNESIWKPLLPGYDILPEAYEQDNIKLVNTIDSLTNEVTKQKPSLGDKAQEADHLLFALQQARVVTNKNLLGVKLKHYIDADTLTGSSYFQNDLKALNDSINHLQTLYGKLWKLENRNWWLDKVDDRYNQFAQTLDDLKGTCIIKASDTLVHGKRQIRLRSVYNTLPVYYTTDGMQPSITSNKYTQPIYTDSKLTISASVIDTGKVYPMQQDSFVYHKAIGHLRKHHSTWDKANAARGWYALVDGRRGSKNNLSDGRWQGYLDTDIDMELDLKDTIAVTRVSIGFMQYNRWGVLFPRQVKIFGSADGKEYILIKTVMSTTDAKSTGRLTHDYVARLNGMELRYLRVVALNAGPMPEWHEAKGKPSWLFADEIMVE